MKQKIVIKVHMRCGKCRKKAMKITASADGVISVALQGSEKDEIVVVGNEVDSAGLCTVLRKKLGHANLLSVEEVKDPKPEEKKDEKKPDEEKKEEGKTPEKAEEKQGDKKTEDQKDEAKKPTQETAPIQHHCYPCQPPNYYGYPNPPPPFYLYTTYDDDRGNSGCTIM